MSAPRPQSGLYAYSACGQLQRLASAVYIQEGGFCIIWRAIIGPSLIPEILTALSLICLLIVQSRSGTELGSRRAGVLESERRKLFLIPV